MFDVRPVSPLTPALSPGGSGSRRRGFTLLEVVLALAILTMALTACLWVVHLGIRSAGEARDQSRAQEIGESVMALISSGVLDVNTVSGSEQTIAGIWSMAGLATAGDELDLQSEEEAWLCSIDSATGEQQNLLTVTVTVTASGSGEVPVSFTLVRWVLDPSSQPATNATNQAGTNSSGSNGSSATSSSNSSGSSGSANTGR